MNKIIAFGIVLLIIVLAACNSSTQPPQKETGQNAKSGQVGEKTQDASSYQTLVIGGVVELLEGQDFEIDFKGTSYNWKFREVMDDNVAIVTNQQGKAVSKITVGESGGVDLDRDGVDEFVLTLRTSGDKYIFGMKEAAEEEECVEQWICGPWGSECQNGVTKRECEDMNNCGTFENRPRSEDPCTVPVASVKKSCQELSGIACAVSFGCDGKWLSASDYSDTGTIRCCSGHCAGKTVSTSINCGLSYYIYDSEGNLRKSDTVGFPDKEGDCISACEDKFDEIYSSEGNSGEYMEGQCSTFSNPYLKKIYSDCSGTGYCPSRPCSELGGTQCNFGQSCSDWKIALDNTACCVSGCVSDLGSAGSLMQCKVISLVSFTGTLEENQWLYIISPTSTVGGWGMLSEDGWEQYLAYVQAAADNIDIDQPIGVSLLAHHALNMEDDVYPSGTLSFSCDGVTKSVSIPKFRIAKTLAKTVGAVSDDGVFFNFRLYVGDDGSVYYDPDLKVAAD